MKSSLVYPGKAMPFAVEAFGSAHLVHAREKCIRSGRRVLCDSCDLGTSQVGSLFGRCALEQAGEVNGCRTQAGHVRSMPAPRKGGSAERGVAMRKMRKGGAHASSCARLACVRRGSSPATTHSLLVHLHLESSSLPKVVGSLEPSCRALTSALIRGVVSAPSCTAARSNLRGTDGVRSAHVKDEDMLSTRFAYLTGHASRSRLDPSRRTSR